MSEQSPLSLMPPPAVAPAELLIIGCGNLLRGDDGVGPILVRQILEQDLPKWVRLADGGTAGMDVAFAMRGVKKLIIVDACQSGDEPGSIFKVPGEELEALPPVTGLHMHAFRWDNALAFGRWLLKDEYPEEVTVYLVEVGALEYGEPLTPPVQGAMERLIELIMSEVRQRDRDRDRDRDGEVRVELTGDGYLRLSAEVARRYFPDDVLVPLVKGKELWLLPLRGAAAGGLLLKQRNAQGDRAVVIWEALPVETKAGPRPAFWDEAQGALRVALPLVAG